MSTYKPFLAGLMVMFMLTSTLLAQRNPVTYTSLLSRARQANAYIESLSFPKVDKPDSFSVKTHFRLEYDLLTFTRNPEDNEDKAFLSEVMVYVDIYKQGAKIPVRTELTPIMANGRQRNQEAKREQDSAKNEASDVPLRTQVWKGVAYARNYAQSISNRLYLEGGTQTVLPQGRYEVVVSLKEEGQPRIRPIGRTTLTVGNVGSRQALSILLNKGSLQAQKYQLMGYGNQIPYGSDIDMMVALNESKQGSAYRVRISEMNIDRKDTSVIKVLETISTDKIRSWTGSFSFDEAPESFMIRATEGPQPWIGFTLNAASYPNKPLKVEVFDQERDIPILTKIFPSKWVDIPTSLLNVSVATQMLDPLVDKEELKRLKKLSDAEKIQYFNEFWKPKDPSPNTDYNELMVEYYRRVDIAYERFSTTTTPGYASDQGKTFLLMGEPDTIQRRFPPDQPALEVWTYGQRQIVFQASSGFGDFKLVKTNQ
jgi:GWxTD domain-containing protein